MASQSPFNIGSNAPQNPVPPQHGSSEQWSGTVFGITPPASPRRTTRSMPRSPSATRRSRPDDDEDANRDRERETRRRPYREPEDGQLPEGWGARMLASENRIRELAQVIEQVNARADAKIAEMKTFVTEVGGRFDQLERALPERIHNLENRQEAFIGTINQLTKHIQDKFVEIEAEIRGLPRGPPSPPSFEGPRTFNIGSPMPGQPTQQPNDQPQEDPWAAFARSRTAHGGGLSQPVNSNASAPTPAPSNAVPGAPPASIAQNFAGPRRPWDPKL